VASQTSLLDPGQSLALAVVAASSAPLILLDGDFAVVVASASFCEAFQIDPARIVGQPVFALGAGEWNRPQLRSLLSATLTGAAEIEAYEMTLMSARQGERQLILKAMKLAYGADQAPRVLLTVFDVTDARASDKHRDDLLREKAVLLQEVQHRVANSLQIISSVILQGARHAQTRETKEYLRAAHERVMSVAEVQRQLAASTLGEVKLKPYFDQLCHSLGASMIRDHHQIALDVDVDDSAVPANASVSLGLIVTELVINALKHAFPGSRRGRIVVGYRAEGTAWTLSVADNGVGMPADAASRKPGLGTSIVQALAKQLQAEVQHGDSGPGMRISIVHAQVAAAAA
jgi:two-component system, sensor histidine kinase PdtaS